MPEDFDALDRRARDLIHVDEALFFFLHQVLHRLVNAHLASLGAALKEIAQHVFHVDAHLFDALAGRPIRSPESSFRGLRSRPGDCRACRCAVACAAFRACVESSRPSARSSGTSTGAVSFVRVEIKQRTAGRRLAAAAEVEDSFLDVQLCLFRNLFDSFPDASSRPRFQSGRESCFRRRARRSRLR